MHALRFVSIVLAISFATVAAAGDFDGAVPLSCRVDQAHDCLPENKSCSPVKQASKIEPVFGLDFAKKEVRSPYRNSILPVQTTTTKTDSIVLQGVDPDGVIAWSALVDRKTGALTVTIADSKGSYVAFGHCKPIPVNTKK
jgi:hypothetical protein